MAGKYALKRNCWENYEKEQFEIINKFGIPQINGTKRNTIPELISFNYVKKELNPNDKGIHFFIDDYQFRRVWDAPLSYIDLLKKYQCVLSPDFSTYIDFPQAIQIYSHYKKHWCAALWEKNGIEVIPTISWGDKESYEWCFDGEPINGTVAVSSQGTQNNIEAKKRFIQGYDEMCKRLNPQTIIFYGNVPKDCQGNIIRIQPFAEKFRIARMEMR